MGPQDLGTSKASPTKIYPLPVFPPFLRPIQRTHNAKGITIPSQQRFVAYFGHLLVECDLRALQSGGSEASQRTLGAGPHAAAAVEVAALAAEGEEEDDEDEEEDEEEVEEGEEEKDAAEGEDEDAANGEGDIMKALAVRAFAEEASPPRRSLSLG